MISRLSSLGDVVHCLPAAVALRKTFPECEIVWCVDKRFAGIVELCGAVDRVVRWPQDRRERRSVLEEIGSFDVAFDLQGLLKSALIVAGAKASRKLGYHWQREGSWLFTQLVAPDPTSLHVTDKYVDVVRCAGAEADRAEFMLEPRGSDVEKARALVGSTGRLVICNAGAGWASKRWPARHFASLAVSMRSHGMQVAFIGAEPDRPVFRAVVDAGAGDVLDLVGKTSVAELVALISIADAHVGGDTGSSHVAAALGKPAIGLYSATRPERTCPYGQRNNTLYDPSGLGAIDPGRVLDKLLAAIGHNREEPA